MVAVEVTMGSICYVSRCQTIVKTSLALFTKRFKSHVAKRATTSRQLLSISKIRSCQSPLFTNQSIFLEFLPNSAMLLGQDFHLKLAFWYFYFLQSKMFIISGRVTFDHCFCIFLSFKKLQILSTSIQAP